MAEYKQLGAYGALCGLHDLRHGYVVRRVPDLGSFRALGICGYRLRVRGRLLESSRASESLSFKGHAC